MTRNSWKEEIGETFRNDLAEVGYLEGTGNYLKRHPVWMEVRGSSGEVLRRREGSYNDEQGPVTEVWQALRDGQGEKPDEDSVD
jgi:hypothetical protein